MELFMYKWNWLVPTFSIHRTECVSGLRIGSLSPLNLNLDYKHIHTCIYVVWYMASFMLLFLLIVKLYLSLNCEAVHEWNRLLMTSHKGWEGKISATSFPVPIPLEISLLKISVPLSVLQEAPLTSLDVLRSTLKSLKGLQCTSGVCIDTRF